MFRQIFASHTSNTDIWNELHCCWQSGYITDKIDSTYVNREYNVGYARLLYKSADNEVEQLPFINHVYAA